MTNALPSSICFRLRAVPDVQSPRLVTAFGDRASDVAERLVFNGLMLVASHARANENLVFTLRYLIDNGLHRHPDQPDDPRDRLRIYVILSAEKEISALANSPWPPKFYARSGNVFSRRR